MATSEAKVIDNAIMGYTQQRRLGDRRADPTGVASLPRGPRHPASARSAADAAAAVILIAFACDNCRD
jgi:hypothetical protein